jgi:hypothetical protein
MFPETKQLAPIYDSFEECDKRAYSDVDLVNEFTHHAYDAGRHIYRKRDHIFAGRSATFAACTVDRKRMDTTANEPTSGAPSGYSDHAPVVATVTPGASVVQRVDAS